MATTLSKDSKIVLKLDLGEDGLRRIPFHKLWDESSETASFDRLVRLILSFKKLPPKCVENERRIVTATYKDEDGDEITISSDSELLDAFEQFSGSQPPILRAKAVVVKVPMKKVLRKGAVKEQRKIFKEIKKEVKLEQKALNKQCSIDNKRGNAPAQKVIHLPTVAPPKTVPKVVNAPTTATEQTNRCNPEFIHGRHTCDGCLTTPIFGTRYHAVNMPDYDLCSKCYPKYTGEHIVFKPMELDRDRHLQARWQRRYRKLCRPVMNARVPRYDRPNSNYVRLPEVASGTQTKRVIQEMDDALKEAIRRSLVDAAKVDAARKKKDKKKTLNEEPAEKRDVKEGEITKEEEKDIHVEPTVDKDIHVMSPAIEKDIHVAPTAVEETAVHIPQVVDIAAGNEATQRSLDTMDPKDMETLRKKLNEFFASRPESDFGDQDKVESTLVPNEETQEKIDAMNPDTKEAIRRSLNQFFENRRVSTEKALEGAVANHFDDVKMAKENFETMDEEAKEIFKRSIKEFLTRRSESGTSETRPDTEQPPSIIIDIEVDDDLSVGTDDVDVGVERIAEGSGAGAETDEETAEESDFGISEGTASKEEWQIVSEHDEMIAVAAQMLGSALFESDTSSSQHETSNNDKE